MIKITSKELEENIDKYISLAEKEEIAIFEGDKILFYFVPAVNKQ